MGLSYNFDHLLDDQLFLDDLHLDYLRHFDDLLHDLFDKDWDLYDPLNDGLNSHWLLYGVDDLSDLRDDVIDRHLNNIDLSIDHNPFYDLLHLDNLRHLHSNLNDPLLEGLNLHYLFFNGRHFDQLLDDVIDDLDDLNWNVDDLLDLDEFGDFDDLLYVFFNGDHLRHLDDSFYDPFDDALDLDYLAVGPEHLQDVVD